jgi:hypothetical protein
VGPLRRRAEGRAGRAGSFNDSPRSLRGLSSTSSLGPAHQRRPSLHHCELKACTMPIRRLVMLPSQTLQGTTPLVPIIFRQALVLLRRLPHGRHVRFRYGWVARMVLSTWLLSPARVMLTHGSRHMARPHAGSKSQESHKRDRWSDVARTGFRHRELLTPTDHSAGIIRPSGRTAGTLSCRGCPSPRSWAMVGADAFLQRGTAPPHAVRHVICQPDATLATVRLSTGRPTSCPHSART